MSYEQEREQGPIGPSGPHGEWVEGDVYHSMFGSRTVSAAEAAAANQQLAEHKATIAVGELSRLPFNLTRPCPKCGCTFPADVGFREEASCRPSHGESEHFDRECVRCGYIWAENLR